MSSTSASRQPSPAPLTPAEELARMMREITPGSDDENTNQAVPQLESSSPSRATDASNNDETETITPSSGPMRSNEQRAARRLADRLGLFPYQKNALSELVKSSSVGQNILLYSHQCVIENKLDKIVAAAPVYKVTQALKANIDSVVMAVLLSSKLSAYKGSIPKDRVLSYMLRDRQHIPSTFDTDTFVSNVIEAAIGESLTQTRASIKKMIRNGINKKTRIFDLATKLVQDTKCTVTVPLCGKIAILRTVHTESSGTDFWDKVDARLELMRSIADGDPVVIARAIKGYLKKDKSAYGGGVHPDVAPEELNAWQQDVDDFLIDPQAPARLETPEL